MMQSDLCLPDDYRSDDSRRLYSLSPFEDGWRLYFSHTDRTARYRVHEDGRRAHMPPNTGVFVFHSRVLTE